MTPALPVSLVDHAEGGWLREVVIFFRQFIVAAFDPYRPELHYMRGPGPACRARDQALRQQSALSRARCSA